MSEENQENNINPESPHDKHFEKRYKWEDNISPINPEPELEPITEPIQEVLPAEPQYEFKLPKGINRKSLPLIVGGLVLTILGFLGIYVITKDDSKPKKKDKKIPTPKTITKTITKVRAPTEEELADYVKKNKKDKIIKEESTEEEEKDKK